MFFVVGNYWVAHHRFVGWLGSIDTRLLRLQLLYLSVIAFLPFPAALLGTLGNNLVALSAFALAIPLALVSVWLSIAFWFVNAPVGVLLDRRRPPEFGGPTAH